MSVQSGPSSFLSVGPELSAMRVSREVLPLFEQMGSVACVVRDADLKLRWCNAAYARLVDRPSKALMGTGLDFVMPAKAAEERNALLRRVIETGQTERYFQCASDQRLLSHLFPIDHASFGFAGVLSTMQCSAQEHETDDRVPTLRTPSLFDLDVLSPAELRVLHHLGRGRTTADIGRHLSRSAKTVEKQIESVHRKLGTSSRAELVRLTVEKGIQAFDEDEWELIIDGARQVRRSQRV